MDEEGLEMGNERDDERERWERHQRMRAELKPREAQIGEDSEKFRLMLLEHEHVS